MSFDSHFNFQVK